MKFVKGFFHFWYDFIIGDDWKIAASVVVVLIIGAGFVLNGFEDSLLLPPILAVALAAGFTSVLAIDVKQHPNG
ncbi:hypothetical protein [Sinomonas sp. G460-2]|uniref:hypothetical protein n=1 Tax=Sinomonas sp. G460-2 TaxID=3393464 RepID=UPI0039EF3A2A